MVEQGETLSEEDVQMLKGLKVALAAGFPEEAPTQMLHVYSDALERVAEAEARLFHLYVNGRLKSEICPVRNSSTRPVPRRNDSPRSSSQ